MTYGQGESLIAERIADFEDNLPSSIKLAYLPNYGRVRLRLTAKGDHKELLETTLAEFDSTIVSIIATRHHFGCRRVGYD